MRRSRMESDSLSGAPVGVMTDQPATCSGTPGPRVLGRRTRRSKYPSTRTTDLWLFFSTCTFSPQHRLDYVSAGQHCIFLMASCTIRSRTIPDSVPQCPAEAGGENVKG